MPNSRTVVIVTLAAVVLFWMLDAVIDTVFYDQRAYLDVILRPAAHDLQLRLAATFLILLSGVFWYRNVLSLYRFRESLRHSEARYRSLIESSPECVVVHEAERPLFANRRTLELLGVAAEDAVRPESIYDFIHPDDHERAAAYVARCSEGQDQRPVELRLVRRDGNVMEVLASVSTVDYGGQTAVITFFRDISDEAETRRDLTASRERLSLALDAARDGVWDWDIPGDRMVYNQAWATMLGLDLSEVEPDQSTWRSLVHPDDSERVETLLQAHLRGDLPNFETEVRLRHARGHYLWVLDRGRVVGRDENGVPVRMTGTHRDITVRKEAQIALEVRNRLAEIFLVAKDREVYDSVLELLQEVTESPVGMFATLDGGRTLRIAAVNHEGAKLALPLARRDKPSDLVRKVIEGEHAVVHRGPTALDCCGFEVNGALAVPVMNRDVVLGIVIVAGRDLPYATADRVLMESLAGYMAPILQSHLANEATEAQLRQSQKMEAIGVLAGGIAHDFNNILQAILGFTSLAREDAEADSVQAHDLDRVLAATDRGRELVRRILLFSRREDQETGPVDIGGVVREALDLLRPTIPANVRLHPELCQQECLVTADAGQIGQVLLNLATNSLHAMEESGGDLTVSLDLVPADRHDSEVPDELHGTDLVVLRVEDTGCGMDPATLDRLYDPFFTTKDVGKGTGLGLSVVHGIVTAHRGDIRIDSEAGEGTRATVYLPSLRQDEQGGTVADGPRGQILVVESDATAAAVASSLLRREGHRVLVCADAREAFTVLAERGSEFDLVISGLSIPGGTGPEMAAAAERAGELPVIITAGSGDRIGAAPASERPRNIAAVVQKPLSTIILGRAVERALGGAESPVDS